MGGYIAHLDCDQKVRIMDCVLVLLCLLKLYEFRVDGLLYMLLIGVA